MESTLVSCEAGKHESTYKAKIPANTSIGGAGSRQQRNCEHPAEKENSGLAEMYEIFDLTELV